MAIDQERYDAFRKELQALQDDLSSQEYFRTIRAKLLDYLAKNDVDPQETLRLRRVVRQLLDDELEPYVERIFTSYADIREIVNTLYADLGVDITRDFQRIRAIEEVTAQELGRYKESTVQSITEATREGLIEGDDVDALQKRIAPASRKAAFYSRTIAKTQLKAYGRVVKAEKARIAEVHYFEYVGILRPVTRPFCRALASTTHHLDQIGIMRNANREPVLNYCGGWNCIHDWEPDPFAKSASEGAFFTRLEGGDTLRMRGDEAAQARYEKAKELNRAAARSD